MSAATTDELPPTWRDGMVDGIQGLFASGEYSDFTVTCGGRVWKVHKIILSVQCSFFKTACSKDFKEGTTNVIALNSDDPETVESMIRHMYGLDYRHREGSTSISLLLHARVFAIADRLFLTSLKAEAARNLQSGAKTQWQTDGFIETVSDVFNDGSSFPDAVKDTLLIAIAENSTALLADDKHSRFQQLVGSLPQLGLKIAKAMTRTIPVIAAGSAEWSWYRCPGLCQGARFCVRTNPNNSYSCPWKCPNFQNKTHAFWEEFKIARV